MRILILFLVISWSFSQDTLWTRRYDNGLDEAGYSVATDTQNNIVVAGVTVDISGGQIPGNCLLVKYDSQGNLLWTKEYDAGGDDWLIDVAIDKRDNIIATGFIFDTLNYTVKVLILKFSSSGDTIWTRQYTTAGFDLGYGVATDSLNNIYVSGSSYDYSTYNLLLLKYSQSGELLWERFYDSGSDDIGYRVAVDNNQNIYVCGIYYPPSYFGDFILIKYLPNGDTVWTRVYDFGQDDLCGDIVIDNSQNIIITGATGDGTIYDILTVKCNPNGDTIWTRIYNYAGIDQAIGVAVNPSQEIFISGVSEGNLYDYITLRYTPSGNLKWEGRFDTGNDDQGLGVTVDNTGNIIVTGASYNIFNYDFLTIKYNPDVGIVENARLKTQNFILFPNPAKDEITLKIPSKKGLVEVKIYDVCGRVVKQEMGKINGPVFKVSTKELASGTYFLEVNTERHRFYNKFVIAR